MQNLKHVQICQRLLNASIKPTNQEFLIMLPGSQWPVHQLKPSYCELVSESRLSLTGNISAGSQS
jgi:hypothetical protein